MANQEIPGIPKGTMSLVLLGIIVLVSVVVVYKSSATIEAGHAGVLFRPFGDGVEIDQTYGEGFHIIAPWNDMISYEVRQQTVTDKIKVLSSNGLDIEIEVTMWFQPESSQLPLLHQEKGTDYIERVARPAIRSATRSVIGRYTPEEIYATKRDDIQREIFDETKSIVESQYIRINQVLVRDIQLPEQLMMAIQNKLKQEQQSLEYEFKLEKEQKEAQRVRIQAEGKAEANRILNASLTDNILKEKGIAATLELAQSSNAKVVVVGNSDGLPLILGNQ